jgi:hypothetical protein
MELVIIRPKGKVQKRCLRISGITNWWHRTGFLPVFPGAISCKRKAKCFNHSIRPAAILHSYSLFTVGTERRVTDVHIAAVSSFGWH